MFQNKRSKNKNDEKHMNKAEFFQYVGLELGERPKIIEDLIYHLTGVKLVSPQQQIREEDEFTVKRATVPKATDDEELAHIKKNMHKDQFKAICEAFSLLWGEDAQTQHDIKTFNTCDWSQSNDKTR